jgi:hypothetical protein
MAVSKTGPPIGNAADSSIASLADSIADLRQQCQEILGQINAMGEQLSQLVTRETELRLILERDTELEPHMERLGKTMRKATTADRIAEAIGRAALQVDPFPYSVIDGLLPDRLYESLVRGLPPVQLFTNKPPGKQQLAVPFELAPVYSQRVWTYLATDLVPNVIGPLIVEKFRTQIDDWIRRNWPDLAPRSVALHGSGGRIMFRRRGYRIRPHRDPKWSFITCIFYIARPGDDETWGTQLYAVADDEEAKNAAPYWIDEKQCRLVEDVKFRPNRVLVFLNSAGAHGAQIPEDAEPADLERYIYQFRIGPTIDAINMLKSMLPEERQALWSGKALVDY